MLLQLNINKNKTNKIEYFNINALRSKKDYEYLWNKAG
jgi:hypothetical protein